MPSLRRAASSPFVRSSPYSSALTSAQANRGQGHRRSSGSETASRRVLADIEWWKVTDGQCDPSAGDPELEQHIPDDAQNVVAGAIAGIPTLNAGDGVERLFTPTLPWQAAMPDSWTESVLPTAEFAALSITPQTPSRRPLELETASSSSSLESTPEPPAFGFRDFFLDFSDIPSLLFDEESAPPLQLGSLRLPPSLLARANTFSDFSFQDDFADCFFESSLPTILAPAFVC